MNDRSVSGSASIPKLRSAYRTELTIPGSESVSVPSRSKSIVLYCMAHLYVRPGLCATAAGIRHQAQGPPCRAGGTERERDSPLRQGAAPSG